MANVIRIDRRAEQYLDNKPRAVARVMDVDALAAEAYRAFDSAWREAAPILGGHAPFMRAMAKAGEKVTAIRVITREWSGEIESAEVWTRASDGAVVTSGEVAA